MPDQGRRQGSDSARPELVPGADDEPDPQVSSAEPRDPGGPARRTAYGTPEGYGSRPYGGVSYGPDSATDARRRAASADGPRSPPGSRLATPIGRPPPRARAEPAHMAPRHDRRRLVVLVLAVLVLAVGAVGVSRIVRTDEGNQARSPGGERGPRAVATTGSTGPPTTEAPPEGTASGFAVPGLLTFRGNPTRTYYGAGPGAAATRRSCGATPAAGGMCAESTVGTRRSCGAAPGGPASPPCSSATAARGWCSAPTTAPCTSSTATRARTSSRPSRPATSSRAR